MLLTRRKQFILGCLFKDVIDDLHGIDCPGLNQSNCVFRLVVVDRDAKVPDFTLFLQLLNCVQPIPFRRADVALFEEVKERLLRGCLKSPANAKFTERGTGFMPALRKLK